MKVVNLAKRPFQNRRPLRRLSAMLWVAVAIFGLLDLWLFWDHLTGFSTTSGQLADVRDDIERENQDIERLGEAIAALSLDAQNTEVASLNAIIADRVFPWGLLFDHLEEVLPDQVWLASVTPRREDERTQRGRSSNNRRTRGRRATRTTTALATEKPTGVALALRGTARDNDELRSLQERLFASPVFENPLLRGQSRNARQQWDFSLDVVFRVDLAQAASRAARDDAERRALEMESGTDQASGDALPATDDLTADDGETFAAGEVDRSNGDTQRPLSGFDAALVDERDADASVTQTTTTRPGSTQPSTARPGSTRASTRRSSGSRTPTSRVPTTRAPAESTRTNTPRGVPGVVVGLPTRQSGTATTPTQQPGAVPTAGTQPANPPITRAPSGRDRTPTSPRRVIDEDELTPDPPRDPSPPPRPDSELEEPADPTPNASAAARVRRGGGR